MEIAGEMEVDILHRDDLGIAAAGRAALDPERGTERGLAQAQHRLLADKVQRIGETDRGGGLALAGRRRRNRRHQDQLAVGLVLQRLDVVDRDFSLVVAVGFKVLDRDAEPLLRNIRDPALGGGLGNFDV